MVVVHEDRAGDPPVAPVRRPPRLLAAPRVIGPVGRDPFGHEEVRGDGEETPAPHLGRGRRVRGDHRAEDGGMGLLVGLDDRAEPDLGEKRLPRRDLPVLAFKIVGRLALPDGDDVADGLGEHLPPIEAADAERLRVRLEGAGADPEQEPALEEVVEHRGLCRDEDRVGVREIGRPRAELDVSGLGDEARLEEHRAGDVLGRVGQVLADVRLRIAQPVGEDDRLAVLLEGFRIVAVQPVHRHGEETELHGPSGRVPSTFRS